MTTALWPITAPEIPPADVLRIRRVYAGAKMLDSVSPDSRTLADEPELPPVYRQGFTGWLRLLAATAALYVVFLVGGALNWPGLLLGLIGFCMAPTTFASVIGLIVIGVRLGRRYGATARALRQWRGRFALPTILETGELKLLELAVSAFDRVHGTPSAVEARRATGLGDISDRVLWQLVVSADQISRLRRAVGDPPKKQDKAVAEVLAPSIAVLNQATAALTTQVKAVESYAAAVTKAEAAADTLRRLGEVRASTDEVAEIVSGMRLDLPRLDGSLLVSRLDEAEAALTACRKQVEAAYQALAEDI
ncbi:hypothetical protein [Streptacidiphilus sp. EB129]|uniref:hypothetical protein n=1 Tax=Streptacidiphilus sp. EB129 TaxID=3156262 RepID=UPI0035132D42